MGLSTWPDLELAPLEERPLLQAARLRRFGVNYLQDAVCTGLGVVAHLDGSHVRLLAFSSRHGRGERPDGAGGVVVADIDLEAGQRNQDPDDKRGEAVSSLRRDGGGDPSLATTFQGPARGLSWGRCSYFADSASVESGGSSVVSRSPARTVGGVGVGAVGGGKHDQGGEVACHIAVACGSEVLLWKVSRTPRGARVGGSAEEGESGNDQGLRYRYSTVSVRTDWHRGSRGSDNSTDWKKATIPSGNIRCLSFRPCGGGSAGVSAAAGVVGGDENVPLTAWYDAGAAVLGSGGSGVVLPAPVARERACGAWSGCGRHLAVSSGGEVRVYSDPSETPLSMASAVACSALDQRPVKAGTVRESPGPTLPQRAEVLPLATEVRGGWLSSEGDPQPGVAGSENTFRTALCVEATMYEGGILSSPGSSPGGGTPSSLSPSARQARTHSSPRSRDAFGDRGDPGCIATASGAQRKRTKGGVLADGQGGERSPPRAASSSPVAAAAAAAISAGASPSPPLMGNMRAMCPAGPLAFFGTTDGGLGLGTAVLAATGATGTSAPFSASSRGNMTKRRGNDLLGAIVNTSNAALTAAAAAEAASEVVDGGGGEKTPRRGGFRHVLPGENWLAGSLRPSSRSVSPSRQCGLGSPESPREASDGESSKASDCERVAESVVGASRPTAAPEVLDLRGKLGDGASGDGGGNGRAGGSSSTPMHPLFRLSLPGGVGAADNSAIGSASRGSAPNTGKAAVSSVRRPWLVRVSCRSRDSGGTADGRSGGSGGVGVKALASLPPGLASPDLLASSDDGRCVAVGSHACDLVACFRLEVRSSTDERSVGTDEGQHTKSSSDPVAEGSHPGPTNGGPLPGRGRGDRVEGKEDKNGARQRRRRHRRAAPLCTLRLPPGYRAKGLAVVKEQRRLSGRCGTSGAAAQASSTGGATRVSGSDDGVVEEVVVLVLGGRVVAEARADTGAVRLSSTGGALFPAEQGRRGSGSSGGASEGASYRTVLLRYVLPPVPSETSGYDAVRGGKGASDSSGDRTSASTCTQVPGGAKEERPAGAPSSSCGGQVGSGASSVSTGTGARGSTPSARAQSIAENGVGEGGGTRLEAIVLEAVASAERRMDDRFDRIERMLVGVCDRLGVLENAVKGQRPS